MIGFLGGDQFELAVGFDADFQISQFGNEFGDRIGDEQLAVLEQHHQRDRDDRLGHRIDAEDGVAGQRRTAGPQRAEIAPIADLAAARDQHGDTRHVTGIDLALHHCREAIETGGMKPDLAGGNDGQRMQAWLFVHERFRWGWLIGGPKACPSPHPLAMQTIARRSRVGRGQTAR